MIEQLLRDVSEQGKMGTANLTIGKLLEKLNRFNNDEGVVFSSGWYFNGEWGSYRGYYEDLYIGLSDSDKGLNKIKNIKKALNDALNEGTMYGYKGGEFLINDSTLTWAASYGHLGDVIVDVQKIKGTIYIITLED